MNETIRRLVTVFGYEVDEASVRRAQASMTRMRDSWADLGRFFARTAVGVTAAAGGLYAVTQATANAGDEAAKTARAVGVTTEAWQELAYAAELSGLQTEALRTALAKLPRAVQMAADGDQRLIDIFDSIGLSADAMQRASPDVQLEMLADAISGIEDPGRRAVATMALLEEQGPQFASLFAAGAGGIREMREEARSLGIVLSHDVAVQAEEFNDTMTRARLVVVGLRNVVGIQLMPVITEAAKGFRAWVTENRKLIELRVREWVSDLVDGVRRFAGWAKTSWETVSRWVDRLGGLDRVLRGVVTILAGAWLLRFVTLLGSAALATVQFTAAMATMGITGTRAFTAIGVAARGAAMFGVALLPVAIGSVINELRKLATGQDTFLAGWVKSWEQAGAETDTLRGKVNFFLRDVRDHGAEAWALFADDAVRSYRLIESAVVGLQLVMERLIMTSVQATEALTPLGALRNAFGLVGIGQSRGERRASRAASSEQLSRARAENLALQESLLSSFGDPMRRVEIVESVRSRRESRGGVTVGGVNVRVDKIEIQGGGSADDVSRGVRNGMGSTAGDIARQIDRAAR